ncbi:MAG: O-antigen ligase family protein [Lysobacter sp.]|nr:O-antigen ligase family protein [Lysobacter sp.]
MFVFMIIYLLLVLIRPQDYPALVDVIGLPLQPIALVVAALFWLLSTRKSFAAPQYLLLACFLVVLMFSKVFNGWNGGAIVQWSKFAPVLLAFVVLSNAVNTRQRIVTAMAIFALCAGVLALHGIEQSQTGMGWTGVGLSQETRIQYVGIFNDPNDLGLLFVMCLPMALYLSGRGGLLGLRRVFWLAVAAVLIYGIYLTDSRGTLLALVVLLGVYVWHRRGAFTAAVMGVAAMAVMMVLPSRLQEMEVSEASAQGRVESWYEGLHMFISSPIFGIGADGYSDLNHLTAHNSFVLVLAETGIVGFTIWLAFVGYCFRMVLAVLRQGDGFASAELVAAEAGPGDIAVSHAEPMEHEWMEHEWLEDKAIALTLLLSLSGFFAAAFFLSRSYLVILYLLAALVVGHYVAMQARYPALPRFSLGQDVLRWPLWALAGVVGLYVMVKVLLALI